MKTLIPNRVVGGLILAVVLLGLGGLPSLGQKADEASSDAPVGSFRGEIAFGNDSVPLILHLQSNDDQELLASMDSPSQGVEGMPAESVEFKDDSLRVEFVPQRHGGRAPQLTITGTWNPSTRTIDASMEQRGQAFPIVFRPVDSPSGAEEPSTPNR